jgi:long-subunit acyl-CoA synthetase (AMP-forming)
MVLQKAFDTYRDHLCLNHMTYAEVADHVAAIRQNMINEKLYPGSKLFIYADGNKEAALLVILAALRYKYIPVIQSSRLSASLSFANNSIVNTDTLPYGYETTDLLIGTSGTSGSPKLVAHSGQALLSNIEGIRSYLSLQEGENILIIRSVANLSVWTNELLLGLFAGCHIHTFEGNLSPSAVTKALTTLNIHYLVSVPTFVHFMLPYTVSSSIKLAAIFKMCWRSSAHGYLEGSSKPFAQY